ncbi:uncharacterized protein [Argopecten irradians]|uniref:uncharacterized protein n=1 Tax=Argopecten irradians TaxID=31199 RepID=UPI00371B5DC5
MISILQSFLRAERTGNWRLHLQSVCDMLPYFAATGHNLYLKSSYVYLMRMTQLEATNPGIYEMFLNGHHVLRRTDRFWAGLSSDLIIEQVLMRSLKTSGGLTRGRGMTDIQRAKWVQSMPACAEINNEMQNITDMNFCTNEQHKEQTKARQNRDAADVKLLMQFLEERSPFNTSNITLRNIETGVVAEKGVDADNIKAVGNKIISSMKGQRIHDFTFKKIHQISTMDTTVGVKIDDDIVQVDPQLLFQRLIAAARMVTGLEVSSIFTYELSSVPSSLFDASGLPREACKPPLGEAIWKMGICGVEELPSSPLFILDGGSLLQRIPWLKGDTFSAVCQQYLEYVQRRYTDSVIVFDGYGNENRQSTKATTHYRRSKGVVGQRVHFTEDMPCRIKKESFLSNEENKQAFLNLLGAKFAEKGIENIHSEGDADKLIALTGIERSSSNNVVVIGEDTDLLVLLLYHVDISSEYNIYFKSDNARGKTKIWDIKLTKRVLGQQLSTVLPVIHSFTGCDTTSRIYGVGKAAALKKISSNPHLMSLFSVFLQHNVCKEELTRSGEEIIKALYGSGIGSGQYIEDLDFLRFSRFVQKTATSTTCVNVQSLPPTKDAANFHTKRVYLQVQEWIRKQCSLNPEEWGWQMKDDRLTPIRSSLPPAPQYLLKVIRCNCKQGCETRRCSCRKHGLDCSASCSECRGVSCSNSVSLDDNETET